MLLAPVNLLQRVLPCAAAVVLCAGSALAQSTMAVDLYNKKIHIANGADVKRAVGGLSQIGATLVALDWSDVTKVNLNVLATVSPAALQLAGGNGLGLEPGDQLTLRDLIYASMMVSDSAAATVLAEFVGGDMLRRRGRGGNPFEAFVSEMNKLAAREGCKQTRFVTPHGAEFGRSVTVSSAADMARLTMYALSRAPFRFYTNQKTRDITVFRAGQRLEVPLRNTNMLLGVGTIDGVKTGNTPASGGCVIITEERPGTVARQADGKDAVFRHRMVVVVLGSADPFAEARSLLQAGWGAYDAWLRAGRPVQDRKELLGYF
jgi:serine-type D-Ala-D-Ala carboxypeptidase (penicillin-binding protein 5/6)